MSDEYHLDKLGNKVKPGDFVIGSIDNSSICVCKVVECGRYDAIVIHSVRPNLHVWRHHKYSTDVIKIDDSLVDMVMTIKLSDDA